MLGDAKLAQRVDAYAAFFQKLEYPLPETNE